MLPKSASWSWMEASSTSSSTVCNSGGQKPCAQVVQAAHRGELGIQLVLQSQQFPLRPLAIGNVLEVHRDAPGRRVSAAGDPDAYDRPDRLEARGRALLHRATDLVENFRLGRLGELLPDVLLQQVRPGSGPELLGLLVYVGQAPFPVQREESVAYTLQDFGCLSARPPLAQEVEVALFLRAPALDEMADLAPEDGGGLQQLLVQTQDLAPEELEDAEETPVPDREGDGTAQALPGEGAQ